MRSRIASWSCSGMPSSMPMVRIGICAPRSAMKSNPPEPTSGSRLLAQNARTLGSSSAMRRGVKMRDSSERCTSWVGGSSNRMLPGGISAPCLMISSTEPRPERYVRQSMEHRSTSSKRLNAQKSYFSL